ncbi:MAG: protein kinase [Planctomycetaceae bacterium]|nr:protein kinase [Planctomycetaceae bacterium]
MTDKGNLPQSTDQDNEETVDYTPDPEATLMPLRINDSTSPDAAGQTPLTCEATCGDVIGPYQLIETLGQGGFGTVFLAQQEYPLRRKVAIKIIKSGMASSETVARFEAERQALALMDHPGIAKVLNAGSTEAGQPYFAMEFVQGTHITQFCNKHRLSVRDRLELFIDVCRAIQHAHSKGIIHRDIKPANILVSLTDSGPKATVIDFGVAKALQQPLIENQVQTTDFQLLGTPKYMSPEQAEMNTMDIDTRSDVYSLGVVLYELLAGHLPYPPDAFSHRSYFAIVRSIRESEVRPPSVQLMNHEDAAEVAAQRQTDVRALQKVLRGDLDWIAMKCVEKKRADRYETTSALAADVRNYLNNEPVSARQGGFFYSLRKFALRYKVQVIAASLIVLALGFGLVSSLTLYRMAERRAQEVLRLSDIHLLNTLEEEMDSLPSMDYAKRSETMELWLERANRLTTRLAIHQETLKKFEDQKVQLQRQSVQTSRGGSEPKAFQFDNPEQQWLYENLQNLVAKLTQFQEPDGPIAVVRNWKDRTPSQEAIRTRRNAFMSDVVRLRPDLSPASHPHLYPYAKNSTTGLWEFVDLRTGLVPELDDHGQAVVSADNGILFVLIPGGTYLMGSPLDEPGRLPNEEQHEVTVTGFLIARYEITIGQWAAVMKDVPPGATNDLLPISATYFHACEYCQLMQYQLPSEAQWEYACRAGTTGPFSGTGILDEMGWYKDNSDNRLHVIGGKLPNQFGLYDMHGNSLEWCFDEYIEEFSDSAGVPEVNPVHVPQNHRNDGTFDQSAPVECVLRGGPFLGKEAYCRSADRFHSAQDALIKQNGFRPVIVLNE